MLWLNIGKWGVGPLINPQMPPAGVCGKQAAWSSATVPWWQWETADARQRRSARNNTCSPSDGDNSVRKPWQLLEIWDMALMDKSIQRANFALAAPRTLDNFHSTVWQEIKGKHLLEIPFCQQRVWRVSAFCEESKNKTEPKLSVPIAWQGPHGRFPQLWSECLLYTVLPS